MLQAEIGSARATAGESLPTRGHLMPDFTLPSSAGKQVSLYDYRGRSNLALFLSVPPEILPKINCLTPWPSGTGRSLTQIRRSLL